ncbi:MULTISPECIES: YwqI/YxiC family protein [Bacillus amyloliquefaciens group]|uniref:YwqI/YxiC family protein n=1 Tax=Bacillus amyloliquefaciens group TaxID=1938374 RepID=UPI0007A6006E|nr:MULTISPECIES: YwqI/YxiC family protein [Bacillus amyloliquefaciens group]MED3331483.1 YwqI/YxiC family protein [Bacillus velezensis]MED3673536.1 YwqI/YxiC family protein [Bacillus velezensis]
MGQEIKIDFHMVKQGLSRLKHASGLKSGVPGHFSGRNQLSTVRTIEELNRGLKELTEAYAAVLAKQIAQTESAVHTMKETDEAISSSMK